jgi:hypothetical protein
VEAEASVREEIGAARLAGEQAARLLQLQEELERIEGV